MEENTELPENEGGSKLKCCGSTASLRREFIEIIKLAWTTILYSIALGGQNIINILFCGRLGKDELAAAALGLSFWNVTGLSIAWGFGSACDTLFSQTYGSVNKKYVGVVLQRSLLILSIGCIIIWALYVNVELILIAFQFDRTIARHTATYVHIGIFGIPGFLLAMALSKYLQNQNIVISVMVITCLFTLLSIPVHYVMVFVWQLGIVGAASAFILIDWLLALTLLLYIKIRKLEKATWAGWTYECLRDWDVMAKFGIAGILMVASEWWVYEISVFLMATKGEIALGAQGALLNLAVVLVMPSLGVALATSIRIGNNLGANQPQIARRSAIVSLVFIAIIGTIIGIILISMKDVIGKAFSDDIDVINTISSAVPFLALSQLCDCAGTVCLGIMQGCGLQKIAAVVNCVVYYVIVLPLMCILVEVADMDVIGTWIAFDVALLLKVIVLAICIVMVDWQKQAHKAQKRAGVKIYEEGGIADTLNDKNEETEEQKATELDVMVVANSDKTTESKTNDKIVYKKIANAEDDALTTQNNIQDDPLESKEKLPIQTVIWRRAFTYLIAILILCASIAVHFLVDIPASTTYETYTCISPNGTEFTYIVDSSDNTTLSALYNNNDTALSALCNITTSGAFNDTTVSTLYSTTTVSNLYNNNTAFSTGNNTAQNISFT